MGITKANEIFDFDIKKYKKFKMTESTMSDVSVGDHEAFDTAVFNDKFINLRMLRRTRSR